jgi:hypothetical protein
VDTRGDQQLLEIVMEESGQAFALPLFRRNEFGGEVPQTHRLILEFGGSFLHPPFEGEAQLAKLLFALAQGFFSPLPFANLRLQPGVQFFRGFRQLMLADIREHQRLVHLHRLTMDRRRLSNLENDSRAALAVRADGPDRVGEKREAGPFLRSVDHRLGFSRPITTVKQGEASVVFRSHFGKGATDNFLFTFANQSAKSGIGEAHDVPGLLERHHRKRGTLADPFTGGGKRRGRVFSFAFQMIGAHKKFYWLGGAFGGGAGGSIACSGMPVMSPL